MSQSKKRKYNRLSAEVGVEIAYTDSEKDVTKLMTGPKSKNLSAGGLLVRHKDPLMVGSEVVVKFILPSEELPILMPARVVRTAFIEEDKIYEIGVCFRDARAEDIAHIQKFVSLKTE